MDSTMKEVRGGASVLDLDPKSTVGGGVEDAYGEDCATEDQLITPWTVSVASGYTLMRDPHHNKGLAFTLKERDAHYLRGLLPPVVMSQELQEKKLLHNIRQYQVPLQKYTAMMDLAERNERLFYKLLIDNVEELLPVVYTPTVGEACQKYGSIFRRPQGLYISLNEKGKILEVLKNWPERSIQVIVVTDGERILGLGDLGCQGMGIPVGKLALYTALGGVRPSACLPITIDVGTNNEKLLNDEFYIGLKQKRATGKEYADLLEEFMRAVKQNYGEKVLVQFEDFANHNAFELLAKYGTTHLVFNDDIQGTASVVLAGLVSALKLLGGTLGDHKFLFLGAGEAGTGIAELIALEMSKQTKSPVEETRKNIWLVDSKGLIVSSRKDSLQHFKKPWAHEHPPVKTLLDAVKAIKPTVLIGTSGVGSTFTKEVVEAMAEFNEKPLILALSNPTSQSECTAEEAYKWTQGRALYASGSPFDPVEYNGKVHIPGQANNAYIFPGLGLGLVISGAIRVHDDMLLAASEALAGQVTKENFEKGLIYPPFTNIRKISAHIAANVAAKAYELGLASRLPRPENLVKYAESCMYTPNYRTYRYMNVGDHEKAIELYRSMRGKKVKPDSVTYTVLISGYCKMSKYIEALGFLDEMMGLKIPWSKEVYSSVIYAYSKLGRFTEAESTFNAMKVAGCSPDVVTYTTMVHACISVGDWEKADALLEEMGTNNVLPDAIAFSAMLRALNTGCQPAKVMSLAGLMREKNIPFSDAIFLEMLSACSILRDWSTTIKLIKMMEPSFPVISVGVLNQLLLFIGKSGKIETMMMIFLKIVGAGGEIAVSTYSIVLKNLLAAGNWRKYIEVLEWMKEAGIQPSFEMYRRILHFAQNGGGIECAAVVQERVHELSSGNF